ARIRVGEARVLREERVDRRLRAELRAAVDRDAGEDGRKGLPAGAQIVAALLVEAVEVLLEDELAVAGDQEALDQRRGLRARIGVENLLDERGDSRFVEAFRGKG